MACSRGAKRSAVFLLKELSTYRQFACSYTSKAFRAQVVEARGVGIPPYSSEQMNLIKQLRERTSAPIKDVKSSLARRNWDIEAAQKDLIKRGVILASKKSSRTAAHGILAVAQTENKAVVVELKCETFFVERNDMFQYLASSLARAALTTESLFQQVQGPFHFGSEYLKNMKITLDHPKLSGETTVQSAITEAAAMVCENVEFRRGFLLSTSSHGVVCSHLIAYPQPGLGSMAGILTLEAEDSNASLDALQRVGSSIARHLVFAEPLFLSKELVPSEAIESEREILKSQAERLGKPQMAMQEMVEGGLRNYFENVVLLEQKFVMNRSVNIQSLLNELSKEVGSTVKIGNFFIMDIGEGIQRS